MTINDTRILAHLLQPQGEFPRTLFLGPCTGCRPASALRAARKKCPCQRARGPWVRANAPSPEGSYGMHRGLLTCAEGRDHPLGRTPRFSFPAPPTSSTISADRGERKPPRPKTTCRAGVPHRVSGPFLPLSIVFVRSYLERSFSETPASTPRWPTAAGSESGAPTTQ